MNTHEQTSLVPVKRGLPSLRTRALAVADKGIRSLEEFRRYQAVSRAAAVGLGSVQDGSLAESFGRPSLTGR